MRPRVLEDILCDHAEWVEKMGWHNKRPLEEIGLIASEVGEAANECRGPVPTNKLGEELADIVLRVGDMAITQGIDLFEACQSKHLKNLTNGTRGRMK